MKRVSKWACLMYHQITDDERFGKFRVGCAAFEDQLKTLICGQYSTIDLAAAEPFDVKNGVLLTFDDGHISNLTAARQLAERGLKGVFYILKNKSLAEEGFLHERDIQEISRLGHVIGVHGKDHKWWTKKSASLLIEELFETKKWLEDLTGKKIITCSAPGGRLNNHIVSAIQQNIPDFQFLRSSVEDYNCSGRNDFLLNSVAIRHGLSTGTYRRILDLDRSCYLCLRLIYQAKTLVKELLGK